jgi:hypothetical protein
MLIGGLAVILRGFPRHTDDIDVTVLGAHASAEQLAQMLSAAGFEPRIDDAVAFAEQNQVLLFRHAETGIDVDVSRGYSSRRRRSRRRSRSTYTVCNYRSPVPRI